MIVEDLKYQMREKQYCSKIPAPFYGAGIYWTIESSKSKRRKKPCISIAQKQVAEEAFCRVELYKYRYFFRFNKIKAMAINREAASATTMENQIPSMPQINGSSSTAAI